MLLLLSCGAATKSDRGGYKVSAIVNGHGFSPGLPKSIWPQCGKFSCEEEQEVR
jgi:hypothetical protein